MQKRVKIAAATWTDVSSVTAEVGAQVVFTADADMQVGRKALAPTAGVAVPEGKAVAVDVKTGDTLVPWVYMETGGILNIESAGSKYLVLDGTGTT